MIDLKESLMLAFGSINSSKLRSALTALGIIIGVAAVVANISLGASFDQYFTDEVGDFGDNFIIINAMDANVFSDTQLEVIRRTPGVVEVSPIKQRSAEVTFRSVPRQITVEGTTQDFSNVISINLEGGNYFSDNNRFVAVVGNRVANERFERPIGNRNSIDISFRRNDGTTITQTFKVIGITEAPEPGEFQIGADWSNSIFIPISVMNELLDETDYRAFAARTATPEEVRSVSEQIDINLARSLGVSVRDIDKDDVKPYMIINQADVIEQLGSLSAALTVLITSVALIALLVGSIGIMNIMLVTVTERTSEIGLMKALGFTYSDLLGLFLIEAMMLGLIGGILGAVIGLIGSFVLELYIGLPHVFPVFLIFAAFFVSLFIGLISGAYPANKAAKMDPVDALRKE